MIKVGIVGATGYAGLELVRLLLSHQGVEISAIGSKNHAGKNISEVYPSMQGFLPLKLVLPDEVLEKSDVIFLCMPHGHSQKLAAQGIASGKKVIDLGADFRLEDEATYSEWYGGSFIDKNLQQSAVYGLPELFRDKIKGSQLVANPGCYPTCAVLGLAPLLKFTKIQAGSILIDAKSGVTGAGKGLSDNTHFPQCNENLAAYKIGSHRHTPEIEQSVAKLAGEAHIVTFTPHLLPVNRGILSTMYAMPEKAVNLQFLHDFASDFYAKECFVKVLPLGSTANLNSVTHSNYCHISLHKDNRTGRIIIISAIDNMVKGAAGQAIQNMNIICGLEEKTGLTTLPSAF